ncbi:hypothetical protein QYE76_036185 [Lolium multiflorum]|uniref:NB-ARC domain-containing protein n=1 Tax=Lolium multiflorum TaxID=4521 RepID=A0AAD8VLW5_LOLMU|nr:hypothetical protein QYE76_036185 [Lolium multiflorum]
MEAIFSTTMAELASRSMSSLVDRYLKHRAAPTQEERLRSLERLLLRLRVVVEEADVRLIASQAMLHQLSILKKEMYRGYYTLDIFSCRAHNGEDRRKDHEVNYSFTPSEFNPAKRVCLFRGNSRGAGQAKLLEQVLGSVRDTIEDMSEFVIFLSRCPHLHRQPYSMYLLLNKCMFGRQMEMERIMYFLLQEESAPGAGEDLAVLPIIGPSKVGKSTLIEHACEDARVRNHFSQILCFNSDDLKAESVDTIRDGGRIKHQNCGMGGGRTLIIIDQLLDIKESLWKRLYSDARCGTVSGSKIIVASRSDKIASFGTTHPLRLQFFTREAYWYFFKVRTFGSTTAEDHPGLTAIAMDIARLLNGCLLGANIFSGLLKANFNLRFWSMALATLGNIHQKNVLLYGERFVDAWEFEEPAYLRRAKKTSSEYFVIFSAYQTCSAETEAEDPKTMSVHDLLFGRVRPPAEFKVRALTSHLPPHYNYMFHCGMQALPKELSSS